MSYVVTLEDFVPVPRYDNVPWTQAQVGYALTSDGPFTVIDTLTLSPVDSDPANPRARNFTINNAPTQTGWLQIVFLDGLSNQGPTDPIRYPPGTTGHAASPTLLSARYGVRHRIRDGVPLLDANPVPFNVVRLEALDDQIPAVATPVQTVFQVRFDDVPTQRYMNVTVCPGTLVAYVNGSWTPTAPSQDVDANGNFTLPTPPVSSLRITYAWQYMSDGEIDQFVDEARQWLREFRTVDMVPDGLVPALVSYASYRALTALRATAARLTLVRGGNAETDWSKLAKAWGDAAADALCSAKCEREAYYTQGPEALDPNAVVVDAVAIPPYTPLH